MIAKLGNKIIIFTDLLGLPADGSIVVQGLFLLLLLLNHLGLQLGLCLEQEGFRNKYDSMTLFICVNHISRSYDMIRITVHIFLAIITRYKKHNKGLYKCRWQVTHDQDYSAYIFGNHYKI